MLTLSDVRRQYRPKIPELLQHPQEVSLDPSLLLSVDPHVAPYFPHIKNVAAVKGTRRLTRNLPTTQVGVVFSGGPAPGGHNVVSGIFDTLQQVGQENRLIGFIAGPGALLSGHCKELKAAEIDHFRNQGGFDLLGSGRTKIETSEQLIAVLNTVQKLQLDALVIIGGDDSNTNAAVVAEYFLQQNRPTCVIGVPKTIDGDIQNSYVPISFGFDTAAKIYSELIGNLAQDTLSSLKYFHFVKLMGRSASHLTLECALKTHPNLTLISEEKKPWDKIVQELASWVESREKNCYGIVLVPEGLLEASLEKNHEKDPHGNVNLSLIETEHFLIEAVEKELHKRQFKKKFDPRAHFYGYEGRCGHPSNFDANYSYALGKTAALLALHRRTALMAYVNCLHLPPAEWGFGGVPLAHLLKMQQRSGSMQPVIDKALVDLQGKPYARFQKKRAQWLTHSSYQNPGHIQFAGDPCVTESIPLVLQ